MEHPDCVHDLDQVAAESVDRLNHQEIVRPQEAPAVLPTRPSHVPAARDVGEDVYGRNPEPDELVDLPLIILIRHAHARVAYHVRLIRAALAIRTAICKSSAMIKLVKFTVSGGLADDREVWVDATRVRSVMPRTRSGAKISLGPSKDDRIDVLESVDVAVTSLIGDGET